MFILFQYDNILQFTHERLYDSVSLSKCPHNFKDLLLIIINYSSALLYLSKNNIFKIFIKDSHCSLKLMPNEITQIWITERVTDVNNYISIISNRGQLNAIESILANNPQRCTSLITKKIQLHLSVARILSNHRQKPAVVSPMHNASLFTLESLYTLDTTYQTSATKRKRRRDEKKARGGIPRKGARVKRRRGLDQPSEKTIPREHLYRKGEGDGYQKGCVHTHTQTRTQHIHT